MIVETYKADMYPTLADWWENHSDWKAIPEFALPKRGWIVVDGDKMLCAGFLYHDPSAAMAQMEWIVTNPENSARESLRSINTLVETISNYADENSLILFTSVINKGLIKLYGKHGFNVSEDGMSNMMRF